MKIPANFLHKASKLLNLTEFGYLSKPVKILYKSFQVPVERQQILRMMVRNPSSNGFQIPSELNWLTDTILDLNKIQEENGLTNQFVYVTVRHGLVETQTDDMWHVDGFSMRTPHVPEQNYIWSNCNSTEYVEQSFPIPETFNPFQHNLHLYLNDKVKSHNIKKCEEETVYLIDPYCVHRRPVDSQNKLRTFWRVSFIPIEIEDDTCTHNPLLPVKVYGRKDIRKDLIKFV